MALDQEYESLQWEVADNVKMKPSEYFRRQCFISIEPSEPYLAQVIDDIGSNNIIFGSDYPHAEYESDIVEQVVALEGELPQGTVEKILWENPARFYGIGLNGTKINISVYCSISQL